MSDVDYVCQRCGTDCKTREQFEVHVCADLKHRIDPTPPAGVDDFDTGDDEGTPSP